MFKKILSSLIVSMSLISVASSAESATRYVDRYVPASVCMIEWNGFTFNAVMIQQITIGEHEEYVGAHWYSKGREVHLSLRVLLINKQYYTVRGKSVQELEMLKVGLLTTINNSCNKNNVSNK